jgi:CHAT domain-containing protein
MGDAYAASGKSDKALAAYQESLDLEKKVNRPVKMAIVLNNMGMEQFRLGRYAQALRYLNEALDIERKLNNPHALAARLNNIGAVYLRQGKYRDAEEIFLERKALQGRIAKTKLIHAGLIETYLALKRYDEALALLRETPPVWRDNRVRHMEYHTQYAQALRGKGQLKEAGHELLQAVSLSESMRQQAGDREGFFSGGGYISRSAPHRLLVSVLAERSMRGEAMDQEFKPYGRDLASAAFYFAELTKARTLLETMAGAARKYDEPEITSDIKRKEEALLKQLAEIEAAWETAYKQGEAVLNGLSKRKETLERELSSLVSEIRTRYPKYAALKYPKPLPASELSLRVDEIVIEYAVTGDEGYAFVVKKDGVGRISRMNLPQAALEEKVRAFMEPLTTNNPSAFSLKAAKELYEILLSAAIKDVSDADKIVIVPDGILGLLPFEALITKEGKEYTDSSYVGDKRTITYSQSATALALTRLLRPSEARKQLFALGNPVYDRSDPRYTAYKQGGVPPVDAKDPARFAYRGVTLFPKGDGGWEEITYPPLPETEEEVRAIAKLFGVRPEMPDVLLNISASETNFRNTSLKDYRYLHFATHADLPGKVQGMKEPFLILGQVENRGTDDGFVTLSEVLALRLDAEMVVLSACSTGRGKMMEGEGVANFSRAFLHAGTKSVVVSLWEVASGPAVEYMKAFYGHLKAGTSRAEALRLSRNVIKLKYPNPFYWAVFILHGEG